MTFWWILATFLAFFVKGISGFANTLVFNSILSFTVQNVQISPVDLILGYPSNIILTIRERKNLDPAIIIPLASMVLAGNLAGVFLLKNLNGRLVRLFFGFVVILLGLEMLTRHKARQPGTNSTFGMIFFGLLSGVFCGLYGVGALLGAYISRYTQNAGAFRSNLCAIFIIENTFRIFLYAFTGILTLPLFLTALRLMPFMLAGLLCGIACSNHIEEKQLQKIIMFLLILSGIMLIAVNL